MEEIKLWVKVSHGVSANVSIANCQDVNDFIEACKKKLEIAVPIPFLEFSLVENKKETLCPGVKMTKLLELCNINGCSNDSQNPLYLHVNFVEKQISTGNPIKATDHEHRLQTPYLDNRAVVDREESPLSVGSRKTGILESASKVTAVEKVRVLDWVECIDLKHIDISKLKAGSIFSFQGKTIDNFGYLCDRGFYVRDCFFVLKDHIWSLIDFKNYAPIYILGTKGIGKSVYRNFILAILLSNPPSVLGSKFRIFLFSSGNGTCVVIEVDRDKCAFSCLEFRTLNDAENFHTYDIDFKIVALIDVNEGRCPERPWKCCLCVYFTSANEKIINDGQDPNGVFINRKLLLPSWNLEEISAAYLLVNNCELPDEKLDLLERWGNIPRLLFSEDATVCLNFMKSGQKILNEGVLLSQWNSNQIDPFLHRFLILFWKILDSSDSDTPKYDFLYRHASVLYVPAVLKVALEARDKAKSSLKLLDFISSSNFTRNETGLLFEQFALRKLQLCSDIIIRSASNIDKHYFISVPKPTQSLFFEDITAIDRFGFWIPESPNFPVLDAVTVLENTIYIWQMTISDKPDLKNQIKTYFEHFGKAFSTHKIFFIFLQDKFCIESDQKKKTNGLICVQNQYVAIFSDNSNTLEPLELFSEPASVELLS